MARTDVRGYQVLKAQERTAFAALRFSASAIQSGRVLLSLRSLRSFVAINNDAMNEVRRAHFAQSRRLIGQFQGREIKTIAEISMAAFKCAGSALDYARALQGNTGHPQVLQCQRELAETELSPGAVREQVELVEA